MNIAPKIPHWRFKVILAGRVPILVLLTSLRDLVWVTLYGETSLLARREFDKLQPPALATPPAARECPEWAAGDGQGEVHRDLPATFGPVCQCPFDRSKKMVTIKIS